MLKDGMNPMSVEFLYELFAAALRSETICGVVARHVKKEYLPDRAFQKILLALSNHYRNYKEPPSYAVLSQLFNTDYDTMELVNTFQECGEEMNREVLLDMLEAYIKGVRLQMVYSEVGKLYNQSRQPEAEAKLKEYAEWLSGFTLKSTAFVNVAETFTQRFYQNRQKDIDSLNSPLAPVTRFYIPDLDVMNSGRNLRGQLTCFLASTGVGKSHIAKHIGIRANIDDGLHVLHFQLEGSEEEALDAYSGGLISKNAFYYERGKISDTEMKFFEQQVAEYKGSITVRSFPRFKSRESVMARRGGRKSNRPS